jgi:hypothetical protein
LKYLNSQGINDLGVLGYITGNLKEIRQRIDKDWSAETKRAVSMAATYTEKAYVSICGELDTKQGKLLKNRLNSWIGAKMDIIRKGEVRNDVRTIEVEKDDFYKLVEYYVQECCKGCRQPDKCSLRDMFLKYDIPISMDNGDCPYWNEGGK